MRSVSFQGYSPRRAITRYRSLRTLQSTSLGNVLATTTLSETECDKVHLLWECSRRSLRAAELPLLVPLCRSLSTCATLSRPLMSSVLLLLWKHTHSLEAALLLRRLVASIDEANDDGSSHIVLAARCADAIHRSDENAAAILSDGLARSTDRIPHEIVTFVLANADPHCVEVMLRYAFEGDGITGAHLSDMCLRLLANDHFFRPISFTAMHNALLQVVCRAGLAAEAFGESTLNKCSRVYSKMNKGSEFAQLHDEFVASAPRLVAKLPLAYITRLIGSLLDEAMRGRNEPPCFVTVCRILRPFLLARGGDEADRSQTWVIAMKVALTSPPVERAASRLLELYVLFGECDASIEVTKPAFVQATRLVCESLVGSSFEATGLVALYTQFLANVRGASFHWILDGLVHIVEALWKSSANDRRQAAEQIVTDVARLLRTMKVSGVLFERIAPLREVLVHFGIEDAPWFWWQCGCGAKNPCESVSCSSCVRNHAKWQCTDCRAPVRIQTKVTDDCPNCGAANPRVTAASDCRCIVCDRCGAVGREGQDCQCLERATKTNVCSCGTDVGQRSQYCPNCYAVSGLSTLFVWQCKKCLKLNNSSSSRCNSCSGEGEARSSTCITSAFEPWTCGCGKKCHPQSRACVQCTAQCGISSYSCPACLKLIPSSNTSRLHITATCDVDCGTCKACRTVHPRDFLMLSTSDINRSCGYCGGGRWQDGVCLSCCAPADKMPDPRIPFTCSNCQLLQCGFNCSSCFALRESLPNAFVWRCDRPVEEDVCGVWNYSWERSCRGCKQGRIREHRLGKLSNTEVRCRYVPWTCSSCSNRHDATTVLLCPTCDDGIQMAPPCELCSMAHLTVECPAPDLMEDAATILFAAAE